MKGRFRFIPLDIDIDMQSSDITCNILNINYRPLFGFYYNWYNWNLGMKRISIALLFHVIYEKEWNK